MPEQMTDKFANIEITHEDNDDILLTLGMVEEWRARMTELDLLLGEAGKEAAMLTRKIKAAEYLMKVSSDER